MFSEASPPPHRSPVQTRPGLRPKQGTAAALPVPALRGGLGPGAAPAWPRPAPSGPAPLAAPPSGRPAKFLRQRT